MAKRQGKPGKTRMVEIRSTQAWYDRVAAEALRLGLPVSTFIRVAVNEWLDRKDLERAAHLRGTADATAGSTRTANTVQPGAAVGVQEQPARIVFLDAPSSAGAASTPSAAAARAGATDTVLDRAATRTRLDPRHTEPS